MDNKEIIDSRKTRRGVVLRVVASGETRRQAIMVRVHYLPAKNQETSDRMSTS
jgi:hypothetical protein